MAEKRGSCVPTRQQQRDTIAGLEEEVGPPLRAYAVSKLWHATWRDYVGPSGETAQQPAPIEMDVEEQDGNVYIDERIWVKWVEWFGVSPSHGLDRRTRACHLKHFEVCILSPYSRVLENPIKTFDIADETGYIELRLRRLFCVPARRMSRLWVCEKKPHARFHLLLDPNKQFSSHQSIDHRSHCILALEVVNPTGTWPSLVPGDPKGSFDSFENVAKIHKNVKSWDHELENNIETVFAGISNELRETVETVIKTAKDIIQQQKTKLVREKESLQTLIHHSNQMQDNLKTRNEDLSTQQEKLKVQLKHLSTERHLFEQEKSEFEDEMNKIKTINQIQESRIKLDVGGNIYTTSILTLTKDPRSMLAAMFSGRHSLRQEEDGSYFIDRDGTHFRLILNFLRDGRCPEGALPDDRAALAELLTEAEYYQIQGLVCCITDKLQSAGCQSYGHTTRKPLNRKSWSRMGRYNKA